MILAPISSICWLVTSILLIISTEKGTENNSYAIISAVFASIFSLFSLYSLSLELMVWYHSRNYPPLVESTDASTF